jgi:hypothetical protein
MFMVNPSSLKSEKSAQSAKPLKSIRQDSDPCNHRDACVRLHVPRAIAARANLDATEEGLVMTHWKATCGVLIGLSALAQSASAQIPGMSGGGLSPPGAMPAIPGAGGIGGLGGGGLPGAGGIPGASGLTGAAPTTGTPGTLWNFLGISKANCAECKQKICASQFGMLLSSGMKPLSGLTGGILPGCCPPTSPAQLAADEAAGGAQGVAAKIKADEAAAKAKIAAIEYLATVDCNYWPDAAPALINSLRNERNECVRFAAARALGTGCCCNEKTVAALTLTVTSDTSDGAPAESSERVKAAAYFALQHCAVKVQPKRREPRERPNVRSRPENPAGYETASNNGAIKLPTYYEELDPSKVVADARRALIVAAQAPMGNTTMPTGTRSVAQAFVKAARTGPSSKPNPVVSSGRPAVSSPAQPSNPTPTRIDLEVVPSSYRPAAAASTTANAASLQTGQRSLFGILSASLRSKGAS